MSYAPAHLGPRDGRIANAMTVDVEAQQLRGPDGKNYAFAIDPSRKLRLVKGLDDAALALEFLDDIERFEKRHFEAWPWAAPR